jgi:hypothetical protein
MLNTGHTYGSIADTMKVLKTEKKGRHLNTLEKYHIYKTSKEGLQMNDTYIDKNTLQKEGPVQLSEALKMDMQLSQLKKEDTVTTTYVRICDVRKWGEG